MYLKGASFENFRNIEKFSFDFDERINIIFGNNAQGKTNVIEGIYIFAGGKSFRHAKDADLRKFGSDFTNISVSFETAELEYKMAMRLSDRRKELYRNDVKIKKLSEFIGTFKSVLFCPAHLSIVQAEPSVRRGFIDSALSQLKPKYLSALIEYQKLLEEKNALLKSYEDKPEGFDMMYDVISEKMAMLGGYITAVRADYLKRLFVFVNSLMLDMTNEKEKMDYVYKTSISGDDLLSENENTKKYIELIEKYREKEKIVGSSLYGCHRDDFDILLNSKDAKIFASQGQQRSIALAIKLSEGEISKEESDEYPVFLFDDVLSELDRDRKNYVLSRLENRQVIITSCDEMDFCDIKNAAKIYASAGNYFYR
ncbi:MAG: DNA replication/repair protein RecF [Clostridiales bacterium]|nr:DNA replication/repair protein RecF [Clostridiales bacterium]